MQVGDRLFLAAVFNNSDGSFANAGVVPVVVDEVLNGDRAKVTSDPRYGIDAVVVDTSNLSADWIDAYVPLAKLAHANQIKYVSDRIKGDAELLPQPLATNREVVLSGNPLRLGEPNVACGASANVWGQPDNPQKLLQLAGAVWEDIGILSGVLTLLAFGNSYGKKLISKYMIVELTSLYSLLSKLSDMDPQYRSAEFQALVGQITSLESRFHFRAVRDRLAAHRDSDLDAVETTNLWKAITRSSLLAYVGVFRDHLAQLTVRYPFEAALYFWSSGEVLKGVAATVNEPGGYLPFDND